MSCYKSILYNLRHQWEFKCIGIRNTEKRIHEGFKPEDLGQAVKIIANNIDLALVSYLTEPDPVGNTIDYVASVLKAPVNEADYNYTWTIVMNNDDGTSTNTSLQTESSICSYIPKKIGRLSVTIDLCKNGTTVNGLRNIHNSSDFLTMVEICQPVIEDSDLFSNAVHYLWRCNSLYG
jgi:hypothetical protein